jgi:hypothetical protein
MPVDSWGDHSRLPNGGGHCVREFVQPGIAKIRFMAVFATIIAPAQQSA